MEGLAMKILTSLLVIILMMSSVVTESSHIAKKKDQNSRTPGSKNNTEVYHNPDVAGIRRVVAANIFPNPNQPCYTQFFANGQPPFGLRTANLQNIRYICQQVNANPQTFYATMFDEGRGIAVYSAYVLTAANVNFQVRQASAWIRTPGIQTQGSNAIYAGQQYDKGHLFPAKTSSTTAASSRSTFQYTNAVPQRPAFNRGQWRVFESSIRQYALQCTGAPLNGQLYLITGASFVAIQGVPALPVAALINQLPPVGANPAIDIPNSMWTFGTCIPQNGIAQTFAVIGNNQQQGMLTQKITEAQLTNILQFDVNTNNLKRSKVAEKVNLIPGVAKSVDIKLPPALKSEYRPDQETFMD